MSSATNPHSKPNTPSITSTVIYSTRFELFILKSLWFVEFYGQIAVYHNVYNFISINYILLRVRLKVESNRTQAILMLNQLSLISYYLLSIRFINTIIVLNYFITSKYYQKIIVGNHFSHHAFSRVCVTVFLFSLSDTINACTSVIIGFFRFKIGGYQTSLRIVVLLYTYIHACIFLYTFITV